MSRSLCTILGFPIDTLYCNRPSLELFFNKHITTLLCKVRILTVNYFVFEQYVFYAYTQSASLVRGLYYMCMCVYLQVKRVMNGVFHSLRGEFDLSETYSGQTVLGVIVTTIKVHTQII